MEKSAIDYRVNKLRLGSPDGLPRLSRYTVNPQPFPDLEPFEPDFIKPVNEDQRRAKFHWIVGHHYLFLMWLLLAECCQQAASAITDARTAAIEVWLYRAAAITRASIGAMEFSGDFSPEIYQTFIRPAMQSVRQDFAGGSSREHYGFFLAYKQLETVFKERNAGSQLAAAAAMSAVRNAKSVWFKRHIAVAENLQPGDSLMKKALEELAQQGHKVNREHYMDAIIRSPEAQDDYDRFFGIVRPPVMFIEDFHFFLRSTIAAVNEKLKFSSLSAESRADLKIGEAVMLGIAEEAIDPEGRLRIA